MGYAIMSISASVTPNLQNFLTPSSRNSRKSNHSLTLAQPTVRTFPSLAAVLSDPYVLQIAETLEDSLTSPTPATHLQKLRETSSQSLLSTPWPSRKDEPFRFTDISFLRNYEIQPVTIPKDQSFSSFSGFADAPLPNVAIVDGHLVDNLLRLDNLTDGVLVGRLSSLNFSKEILEKVSEYASTFDGDMFWSLNGVGAPDLVVVYVPEGCRVESPLHLTYFSVEGSEKGEKSLPISNPRVLVVVEKGGEISIVEEYVGVDGGRSYWANPVMEVVIGEGAKVDHSYIQNQSHDAAHTKWTWIRQELGSTYKLVEVSSGGKLSRHNVHVEQVGAETVTELSTFHLVIGNQTQDLHSRLILNHPRGVSRQLHKCIVAHSSGQAVFDGNVQVNRYAQQTDAGQLTRTLLLEPRATINVKPNLQIIADDVKCSHGAAISDLEESQLFYFRARGIDRETARKALIFSFAAEVVESISDNSTRKKVQAHIRELLEPKLSSK